MTVTSPEAAICMAMSLTSSLNLSPRATKSVSQFSSTSTPSLHRKSVLLEEDPEGQSLICMAVRASQAEVTTREIYVKHAYHYCMAASTSRKAAAKAVPQHPLTLCSVADSPRSLQSGTKPALLSQTQRGSTGRGVPHLDPAWM